MANPIVSIVLPTYNGSRHIHGAIQACLEQTYTNWELIVVDDASTDDTADKVARYVGERISLIRHNANRRLPASLNTGISHARGKYLTWTSDDNVYRPDALFRMVRFLDEHPSVAVVYTDFSMVDGDGKPTGRTRVPRIEGLLNGNCVGPCFLYRRQVQERVGWYSEDMFLAEDYDFWLRASIDFNFAELHEDLYLYRLHPTSLTSKYGYDTVRRAMDESLCRTLPNIPWASAGTKSRALMNTAGRARYRKDTRLMLRCLFLSFWNSPFAFANEVWMRFSASRLSGRSRFNRVAEADRG